tara:strand:+ start:192 stop:626 length:435 start_codon:yes stop_codon:yes gene_type:complete
MGSLIYLLSGIIFSVGLGLAGMLQPSKVIGFLNPLGEAGWDPSLAFVMAGAIGVHLVLYKLTLRREKPVCADEFGIPAQTDVNKRLLFGSAIFGAGWGIAGYCPGPGLASLSSGAEGAITFVAAMILGMGMFHFALQAWNRSQI